MSEDRSDETAKDAGDGADDEIDESLGFAAGDN